jgi:amidase
MLYQLAATELVSRLRRRDVSAVELFDAYAARIEACNPTLNALVSLSLDEARDRAQKVDHRRARGDTLGPLAGLPIAIKDTELTAGIRTTFGSPVYREFIPEADSAMVQRLKHSGVNVIGKSNVPEFGLGSHTFNPVFGATRNPFNQALSAGGSSGGAAAAVTSCMVPFADGSDFGGSLRNPGSFNNLIGLRTTFGRVARYPAHDAFAGFTVNGPIARSAGDAALLLSAMAGPDLRDPYSIESDPKAYLKALDCDFKGVRIAFSATLGGLPFAPQVTEATRRALKRLESLGCTIEEDEPDLAGADAAFETLRAVAMVGQYGALLRSRRHDLKDTAVWNIEAGLALDASQIAAAQSTRTRIFHGMRCFLEKYRFLVCPVSQVLPFTIETSYPTDIDGVAMSHYLEWMRSCSRITMTAHPAISLPGEFTAAGLPVGLQVVGRYRDEWSLLQLAHALESVGEIAQRRPVLT